MLLLQGMQRLRRSLGRLGPHDQLLHHQRQRLGTVWNHRRHRVLHRVLQLAYQRLLLLDFRCL